MILYDEREERFFIEGRRASVESLSSDDSSVSSADYPLGVSYHPLGDYAIYVQNDANYIHYREDIYSWLLTVYSSLNLLTLEFNYTSLSPLCSISCCQLCRQDIICIKSGHEDS